MTTVRQLRKDGYKVKVLHHRNESTANNKTVIHNLGGHTEVVIDSPNGEHFKGIAFCSKKDNYNKKLGVKIALGRAMFGNHDEKKS